MQNYGKHTSQPTRRRPTGTDARRNAARAQHVEARAYAHARKRRKISPIKIVVLAALILALFFSAFSLVTCMLNEIEEQRIKREEESLTVSDRIARYESPYDWSGLDRSNGRYGYYENGELKSLVGVDVSAHQKAIDWQAVSSDGIEFAFVRLGHRGYTEGGLTVDEYAAANLDGASSAGLLVGAYFFSQAITPEEAREEARLALEVLDGRQLDLPVAYDHETVSSSNGRANDISSDVLTECAVAFCEIMEDAGYRTMVYGNARDMSRYHVRQLGNRPLWHAEYDTPSPLVFYDIAVWQYSSSGQVAGITGGTDMNILLTTAPQSAL